MESILHPALMCKECNLKAVDSTPTQFEEFVKLTCNACSISWTVCRVCLLVVKKRKSVSFYDGRTGTMMNHLNRKVHLKSAETLGKRMKERDEEEKKEIKMRSREIAELYFPVGSRHGLFFRHQFINQESGHRALVMASYFPKERSLGVTGLCRDNGVLEEELDEDFEAARLFIDLPPSLQRRFAKVYSSGYQRGIKHSEWQRSPPSDHPSNVRYIKVPSGYEECKKRYSSTKTSIGRNLPSPEIIRDVEGYARVSIVECIRLFFAYGSPFQIVPLDSFSLGKEYSWITETPRMQELVKGAKAMMEKYKQSLVDQAKESGEKAPKTPPCYVCPLVIWKDDYDPNNTRKSKGSNHLQVLTIAPAKDRRNNLGNSYPLALGDTANCKHALDENLLSQLESFSSKPLFVYSATLGQEICVVPSLYAMLCDQPERRDTLHLMHGNSTFHARFLVSGDHRSVWEVIATCKSCLRKMRDRGIVSKKCDKCANWDITAHLNGNDKIKQKLMVEPPPNYPTKNLLLPNDVSPRFEYVCDGNKILPHKITRERLHYSLEVANYNLEHGLWTDDNVRDFLKVECVGKELTEDLISNAKNIELLRIAREKALQTGEFSSDIIIEDSKSNPDSYKPKLSMPSWNYTNCLDYCVDVIMHLLFLGVVKTTLKRLRDWISKQAYYPGLKKRFKRFNQLLHCCRSMGWLKLRDYCEAGCCAWISENFLAFSRLVQWFFQDIHGIQRKVPEIVTLPSDKPNKQWKRIHFQHWLQERGEVVLKKTTVRELRERVESIMKNPDPPAQVRRIEDDVFQPEQVMRMVKALDDLLNAVMSPCVDDCIIEKVDLRVRLFLAEFELFDRQTRAEKEKPKIVSSYNFLCLMNLPSCMKRYGPLRNLWEGHRMGEGSIPDCKVFTSRGQREGFEWKALERVHQSLAFDKVISSGRIVRTRDSASNWDEFFVITSRMYKRYVDRNDVMMTLFGERKPLSVVHISDGIGPFRLLVAVKDVAVKEDDESSVGSDYDAFDNQELWCKETRRVKHHFHQVLLSEETCQIRMNCDYHEATVSDGSFQVPQLQNIHDFRQCHDATTFGVLLPLVEGQEDCPGVSRPKFHLILQSRYQVTHE